MSIGWTNPYLKGGKWFRANTHLHTFHGPNDTIRTDPIDIIKWYRNHGYSILNFSDHCCITNVESPYDDFIVFCGHESDCIIGIDVSGRLELDDAKSDERLDRLKVWTSDILERNGIVQIAHPLATLHNRWQMHFSYLRDLDGATLIEVYNHRQGDYDGVIHWREGYKYGVEIWDALLNDGMRIFPTAVDDSHDYLMKPQLQPSSGNEIRRTWIKAGPCEEFFESGGGWMSVLSEELTCDSIKKSICNGAVYASQGPEFRSFELEKNILRVCTGHEMKVTFIVDGRSTETIDGETASFVMPDAKKHKYVRIEITDSCGRKAWSSPFFAER